MDKPIGRMRQRIVAGGGRLRSSSLVRNSAWALIGQIGRLLLQSVYFVLITRVLGADGYGMLAAVVAYVAILFPLAGWGTGNLLVMHVSRDAASFSMYWGLALFTIFTSGSLFTLVGLGLSRAIMPDIPIRLVLIFFFADLFCFRIVETTSQVFQALDRMAVSISLGVLPFLLRLGAIIAYAALIEDRSVVQWASWYLVTNFISAIVAIGTASLALGGPRFQSSLVRASFREGGYFAIAQMSASAYSDTDKVMLARMTSLDTTGIYAAAYRVIYMAFVPVRSLLFATYSRFFRYGADGLSESARFAFRILPLHWPGHLWLASGCSRSLHLYPLS